FQTLSFVGYWVYVSRGLTGELFRYSLVSAAIRITCIVVGSSWGVLGIAAGYALAPALSWPISLWWLSRHSPVPTRRLYSGALRILCVTLVVALTAWAATLLLQPLPGVAQLGGAALGGALT